MKKLTLTKPDDWHLHLRDGDYLTTTVPAAARQFRRAIIMPNLKPPITNVALASAYKERIQAVIPRQLNFQPLMTLYLTDTTSPQDIIDAKQSGIIYACKLYPMGATTHSEMGVSAIKNIYLALEIMEKLNVPLLMHGEVTDLTIDIFDREKYFIDDVLTPLRKQFPRLKIVFEHITTQEAVDFVLEADKLLGATITAHHLLLNRNAIFHNGIRPHHYCLPILKRKKHQEALIRAATSGNPKFFLGTDSAPHPQYAKESACGCAGIYTAHAAIELYAEVFDQAGMLENLESFASYHGADFYGLARNKEKITLIQKPWISPEQISFGDEELIPFRAGKKIGWSKCRGEKSFAQNVYGRSARSPNYL